jgi:NADH-quinone oxidoreductase subunit K
MQSLSFSFNLFLIGVLGIFLNRKNIIILLLAIEVMLLAINYNLVITSVLIDDIVGQIFALLILTVAAAESAIGLALLMIYYRVRGSISIDFIRLLKG